MATLPPASRCSASRDASATWPHWCNVVRGCGSGYARCINGWWTSLRLTPDDVARGDGLDVETLDLPPGGGLLLRLISDWSRMKRLNRLGMYRMLAAVDSRPVAGAPALLAITGAADAHTCLAAGRVLAQAWYRLEAAGVAVQPYYVISDMLERLHRDGIPAPLLDEARTLAADTTRVFGLADGERMLICCG